MTDDPTPEDFERARKSALETLRTGCICGDVGNLATVLLEALSRMQAAERKVAEFEARIAAGDLIDNPR